MITKENISCLIPLRGGSKSIPGKNIKEIAGKPLCFWAISAAAKADLFDKIYISTDSVEIEETVKGFHIPNVEIVKRPEIYAQDHSTTEEVMLHLKSIKPFDVLFTIQVTSPLTRAEDIRGAYELFVEGTYDSLLTGVETKRFFWSWNGDSLNYDYKQRPRRQDFSGCLMENGAFYITKREILEKEQNRLGGKIGVYTLPDYMAIEIDEPDDWNSIERILKEKEVLHDFREMKILITDVDGVLTDAGMYYSSTGEELKKFNTRDGKGVELLREAGMQVAIITSENTRMVADRAKKLAIDYLFQGAKDKMQALLELESVSGIPRNKMVYIGDDINDEEIMRAVAFSFAPADAMDRIKNTASKVLASQGGKGVFREAAEHILYSLGAEK